MSRVTKALSLSITLLFAFSCSKPAERMSFGKKNKAGASSEDGLSGSGSTPEDPSAPKFVVGARRLNNREYNATVRDLLGTSTKPADNFPADPIGLNFDNVGASLSISPVLGKLFYTSAMSLSEEITGEKVTTLTGCRDMTEACLQKFVASFGMKAWRRPLTVEEQAAVMKLSQVQAAGSLEAFAQVTVLQLLVSPNFLFRFEFDATPDVRAPRKLDAYELASRISYFLWASMPDAQLFAAAADKSLLRDDVLSAEIKRMLADPKAESMVKGFGSIWFHTDKIRRTNLDNQMFPKFNAGIRDAMANETEAFFAEFLKNDLDFRDIVTADFTFVNDELAKYYDLPLPGSTTVTRVELPQGPRRGVLGQGSFLVATSAAQRTSVVRRGAHVLETFLCSPKLDLPAGLEVKPLPEQSTGKMTTRQALKQHTENPTCVGCHQMIDPPGFAMEGFGPDGAIRAVEGGLPIDATGVYTQQNFNGAEEFRELLRADPKFESCVAKKFIAYGLGRNLGDPDDVFAKNLLLSAKTEGNSLRAVLKSLILSETFRSR